VIFATLFALLWCHNAAALTLNFQQAFAGW
jgi:hypothetical protein